MVVDPLFIIAVWEFNVIIYVNIELKLKLIDNKFTTLCYPFAAGNRNSNRVHMKICGIPIIMRIRNHSNDGKFMVSKRMAIVISLISKIIII